MILRDALDIRRGTAHRNKIYKGTYKVWDRNKIALEGYCKQETTEGKNYCGIPDQTFTFNGVDVTIEDGTITLNGTCTSSSVKNIDPIEEIILNGDYTLNLIYKSGEISTNTSNFNIRKKTDSSVITPVILMGKANNFVRHSILSDTSVIFGLYLTSGTVFENYKYQIQIVKGTNPDYEFEKYTGGQPSPNPDYPQEIEVMQGRQVVPIQKNRFDKNNANVLNNTYIGSSSIGIANGAKTLYIPCNPNTNYTISRVAGQRFIVADTNIMPANTVQISNRIANNTGTSITTTTSSNAQYLVIFYYLESADTLTEQEILNSLQILENIEYTVDLKSKNELDANKKPYSLSSSELKGAIVTVDEKDNGILNVDTTSASGSVVIRSEWTSVDSKNTILLKAGTYFSTVRLNIELKESDVSKQTDKGMFTVEEDFYITQWFLPVVQGIVTTVYLQLQKIEESSTDTDYEPYYDYKLAGIGDYKDNFYTDKGKWYFKQNIGNVVLDGSETWGGGSKATVSTDYTYVYSAAIDNLVKSQYYIAFCNKLKSLNRDMLINASVSTDTISVGSTSYQKIRIMVLSSRLAMSSVASFKNWLSENNIELYYVLNTPAIEEITAPTLINQLNALYQAI